MAIKEKVISIIQKQMSDKSIDIQEGHTFMDDLGFDSLDTVQLVMDLEEEFEIDIPDSDTEDLVDVAAAIEYIKNQA